MGAPVSQLDELRAAFDLLTVSAFIATNARARFMVDELCIPIVGLNFVKLAMFCSDFVSQISLQTVHTCKCCNG